jgi:hypothetical protein
MSRSKTVWPILVLLPLALLFSQQGGGSLTQQYKETADKLIAAALADHDGYDKLAYLCDRIGNRLSGSPVLEQAIVWAAAQMKRDGLENVVTPALKVPHWVRGRENAEITAPVKRRLTMLALGGSVATPSEGITAEVVPVASFDELQKAGRDKVAGKIVLFNVPYEGYGKTVQYRGVGASRAAALGAVAMLLRSVGSLTQQTPHTGVMMYLPDAPKVPAAAVTAEDAMMIQRLTDAGDKVTVHLFMEAHMEPDADSANVIGEIRGREKPDEIVVMGGHLDSWVDPAASRPCKQSPPSRNWVCGRGARCAWSFSRMKKMVWRVAEPIASGWAREWPITWQRSKWMAAPKSRWDLALAWRQVRNPNARWLKRGKSGGC